MFPRSRRLLAATALLLSLCAALAAQNDSQPLKIELKSDAPIILSQYICQLEDLHTHEKIGTADQRSDDTFIFYNIPNGEYHLTITDHQGGVIHEELISFSNYTAPIAIYLPKPRVERPPSGPVSMAELRHPPAPKALSAFLAAQRFSESGNYARAARELEKAIRISPDYADAYNNLAVQHIRMGDFQSAVAEIQKSIAIAKPGAMQLVNLAYVQCKLERYEDAAKSARESLRLDPHYAQGHYILGALLIRDPRTQSEGVSHLEIAAHTIPSAQDLLDRMRSAITR